MSITKSCTKPRFRKLVDCHIVSDGTEQDLIEYGGLGKLSGYVDLSTMSSGDSVTVREYARTTASGPYLSYSEDTYSDAQDPPVLYFDRRESIVGFKATLQQTSGAAKFFDLVFMAEE